MARIITLYRKMKNNGSSPIEVFVAAWRTHNSDTARGIIKILFELDSASLLDVIKQGQDIVFSPFEILVKKGKSPSEIFQVGLASGLDRFDSMQLLAYLYDMNITDAKTISHSEVYLTSNEIEVMLNDVKKIDRQEE